MKHRIPSAFLCSILLVIVLFACTPSDDEDDPVGVDRGDDTSDDDTTDDDTVDDDVIDDDTGDIFPDDAERHADEHPRRRRHAGAAHRHAYPPGRVRQHYQHPHQWRALRRRLRHVWLHLQPPGHACPLLLRYGASRTSRGARRRAMGCIRRFESISTSWPRGSTPGCHSNMCPRRECQPLHPSWHGKLRVPSLIACGQSCTLGVLTRRS